MKKYVAIIKIRFINSLQYRIAAFAGIITQVAWSVLGVLALSAFYKSNPSAYPMGFSQSTAYIWIQQAFLPMFKLWFFEEDIFDSIQKGNIAYELVRPVNLYNRWFCQSIASRLAKGLLRCIPVLIIAFLVPAPYGLILPPNFMQFLLFLVSMALGLFVIIAFCMLVYISTFYLLSPAGMKTILVFFADFLAGSTIPLPFFPDKILSIVEILPFSSMQDMPLRIYSGNIAGIEAIHGILLQIVWLIALTLIGKLWMQKATKTVMIQGG
jgi:ABC-2 type transport system permease protein